VAVDALEAAGDDSLWLPEMVYGQLADPFIGMAHALACTSRLKVGTRAAVSDGNPGPRSRKPGYRPRDFAGANHTPPARRCNPNINIVPGTTG
jgi:hypothetical protein